GVSRRAIIDLVRVIQYGTLYHVASLIDGSRIEDVPIRNWTLYQVDENDHLAEVIQGLHEVLLSLDPAGRARRPRESDTDDLLQWPLGISSAYAQSSKAEEGRPVNPSRSRSTRFASWDVPVTNAR